MRFLGLLVDTLMDYYWTSVIYPQHNTVEILVHKLGTFSIYFQ